MRTPYTYTQGLGRVVREAALRERNISLVTLCDRAEAGAILSPRSITAARRQVVQAFRRLVKDAIAWRGGEHQDGCSCALCEVQAGQAVLLRHLLGAKPHLRRRT